MRQAISSAHWRDADGKPDGGSTDGNGFTICWQRGPLGRGENRREPNGAFVEDIIAAAIDRLAWYQSGEFTCEENRQAIVHLNAALDALAARTRDRESRGVEGTHEP
jgi:hypothetical protein